MFANTTTFIIHKMDESCGQSNHEPESNDINVEIMDFVKTTYPKQKYLSLVFSIMLKKDLINNDLCFVNFNIHIADFCSFINNKFGNKTSTNSDFLKLCKHLQKQKIKFPKVSIKNPVAQKYLC